MTVDKKRNSATSTQACRHIPATYSLDLRSNILFAWALLTFDDFVQAPNKLSHFAQVPKVASTTPPCTLLSTLPGNWHG